MSAFAPRLSAKQNPDGGRYLVIEGLPARFMVGPLPAQVQFSDMDWAGAGVKYVMGRSPPAAAVVELERVGIKWLIDDSMLTPAQLADHIEASGTPRPAGERCRPLFFQVAERDFDLLMANAHRVGCALLMGQAVWIHTGFDISHATILAGAVLVLVGCDHQKIAAPLFGIQKLEQCEPAAAQLSSLLAHVRQRSIENCRLAD